ncbi:Zinc finger ZZ-type [Penicillium lagena]|uniref:Zinc finger ZZ-type n=1 Tax=Penicillium lagena TaxID=94218 RepID=UPI00253FB15E|nr:Zinc finger ZZ-type [Penicillium lagena]KAJ5624671.1 Zinc finger ZZ-type [Penicillium lagena]
MASPLTPSQPLSPDHLVTVKVLYNENNRRFKLPLKDLKPQVFPQKLRTLLGVPVDVNVIFERYSDSAGSYIRLDCDNVVVYKSLYRAAKAKSKLRIKATTVDPMSSALPASEEETSKPAQENQPVPQPAPRYSYLDTVLSSPIPASIPEILPSISVPPSTCVIGSHQPNQSSLNPPCYRRFEMDDGNRNFPVISHSSPSGMFCIDCNNCGRSIVSEHYHCSICENGDYDLCPQCVDAGASCRGDGHWLIKRVVSDGIVTNSTTEKLAPREASVQQSKPEKVLVEATAEPVPEMAATSAPEVEEEDKHICNGCCRENDGRSMVRCAQCEDYDLCLRCLLRNKHGHHPAHAFKLGSDRDFCLKNLITSRCAPGRLFKHAAVCDGCEKRIIGIRHKCMICPDWDYCQDCVSSASQNHPDHRFVPIYDALAEPPRVHEIHYGIFCDGPLCKNKPAQSYITGARYKCAVCDDTDFCANCEALPTHQHNRTHPLIKFKTPVRHVTVNTMGDDGFSLGDQTYLPERISAEALNEKTTVEKAPVEVDASKPAEKTESDSGSAVWTDSVAEFQGQFIRDTIPDGTKLPPDTTFEQTWTLHNPGPRAWPVGTDVRFVGGDTMFNVDATHPSSVESIRSAMESNKLSAPLEAGESADFTVTLRTPSREGTVISYWRLKLPNGMAIGHRLWCDVQVQESTEIESVAVPVKIETPAEASDSGMIFPKLDKESPETSTHEAITPHVEVEPAPTVSNPSEPDVSEDMESLSLDDADTETGFLTDEEYDVLDASDQEYLEAKQSVN